MVVVDSTEFWFTGGRYEHHLFDYVFANKLGAELVDKADIIGRSCYGDRLFPTVPIPKLDVGDVLAVLDTGAYQEVSMSNFNAMPRPAAVLVKGGQAAVVRRRETEADVFDRDIYPGIPEDKRGGRKKRTKPRLEMIGGKTGINPGTRNIGKIR